MELQELAFLLLDSVNLPVIVQFQLTPPFLAGLLQKVQLRPAVFKTELAELLGTQLRALKFFLLLLAVVLRLRMAAKVELLADNQILLLQLPGLGQIVVTDFLRLTHRLFLRLLVVLRYHGLRVHLPI